MKFLQRRPSIERRNNRNGFLFCLPWCIGFLLFFFIPLIQSIAFSFSKVSVTTSGFDLDFVGLDNYYYILFQSPEYVDNLLDTLTTFGQQIPIIFVLSLIIAMILNSKYKGRTFFRSLCAGDHCNRCCYEIPVQQRRFAEYAGRRGRSGNGLHRYHGEFSVVL